MHITTCGPGDEQTWPACSGHPCDPRTVDEDDGLINEVEALDLAHDEILATAEVVADWLAKASDCPAGKAAIRVSALPVSQILDGSVAVCLAALFGGTEQQAKVALYRLVELAEIGLADDIKERARDILRKQEVELRAFEDAGCEP